MITHIRKRAGDFGAIVFLVIVAAVVGGYILHNERLRFPFIEEKPLPLNAEFSTAQAVTPGQGQTVRVAGIKIGDIGKVTLRDGRAVIGMNIDPQYKRLVHTDASALLRPRTGLKDMFIELNPGTNHAPVAKAGWTLPLQNTLPDVNPDEILSALDSDTRDYLKLLINGAGQGLNGRGSDLQEVFSRFEPTNRDIARLTGSLSQRRQNLRHLVHSLQTLNTELAGSSTDITQLVEQSAIVFRSFAAEQGNLRRSLRDFPPALQQTAVTLGKVQRFADVLRPTADRLRPSVRAITPANVAVRSLAVQATPVIRDQVRPFVTEARPLVGNLIDPARRLADATPHLRRTFVQLNNLFNLLGYNRNGREGPGQANRDEGFLFWIAWTTHQGENTFRLNDAFGPYRPVFLGGTCETLSVLASEDPTGVLTNAFNLLQITQSPLCT